MLLQVLDDLLFFAQIVLSISSVEMDYVNMRDRGLLGYAWRTKMKHSRSKNGQIAMGEILVSDAVFVCYTFAFWRRSLL